ncbi:MAG: TonB-dependent receptor [Acidiferrobacterales bacterium]|nr:TonB-dependent receptor [Acidiferrobacterales bacterium]
MKSLNKYMKITFISMLIAAFGTGAVAHAQGLFLEEIVVTARKVEESLQDVSLSISAFTAEDISDRSIQELEDVALFTPGLTFEDYSNGGFGTPTVRGASQISITQLEQNVSTFLDGVYIPRQYAVDIGTMDLDRVEVVKGPQSALYGANSFMGAINYVSAGVDLEEFGADIGATLGSDERQDFSAAVNVPFVPGKFGMRVAAGVSEFDGDWDNDYPDPLTINPGTNDKIGGWDNSSYEVDIAIQPTDALSIDLGYKKFDVLTETKAQARLSTGGFDLNCGGLQFGFIPNTYCGELPATPTAPFTGQEIGFVIDPRSFGLDSETDFLTAGISYDINDQISVSYQYGNIEGDVFSTGQSDRDPLAGTTFSFIPGVTFNAFTQNPIGNFDYDSHELRVEFTPDTGVSGMLGVFVSDGEDYNGSDAALVPVFLPVEAIVEAGNAGFGADETTTTEIKAIFGRVAIPLLQDKLVLGLEARHTDETKDFIDTGLVFPTYEDTFTTARISFDYRVSDDSLVYLSAAQGVKSGGLNGSSTTVLLPSELTYGTDENITYELGTKSTFLNGALQLNAAVYAIDWSDLQISTAAANATSPFATGILTNLGSASSKGAEFDLIYAATEGLTLNASLALNDATYDDGTISQRIGRLGLCADGSCPVDGNLGGNSLPRSSDEQWSIGAMYEGVAGGLDYFLRGDYSGQSEQFVSELNTAIIPSREILNLRAGISKDAWSAELWVKNALDEEYVSNSFYIPLSFQVEYVPTWGNKRRIGLDLKYSF